jgi:hypothetical protein
LKAREFEAAIATELICLSEFSDARPGDWANQFAADTITGARSPEVIPGAEFSGQTAAET